MSKAAQGRMVVKTLEELEAMADVIDRNPPMQGAL